jgi:hypothetical protein
MCNDARVNYDDARIGLPHPPRPLEIYDPIPSDDILHFAH